MQFIRIIILTWGCLVILTWIYGCKIKCVDWPASAQTGSWRTRRWRRGYRRRLRTWCTSRARRRSLCPSRSGQSRGSGTCTPRCSCLRSLPPDSRCPFGIPEQDLLSGLSNIQCTEHFKLFRLSPYLYIITSEQYHSCTYWVA